MNPQPKAVSAEHIELTTEEKKEMTQPYPASPFPYNLKLEPGKVYRYCTCGLTKTQPFCDESHVGTIFQPLEFVGKNATYSSICGCRRNKPSSGAYCDGSHSTADLDDW